MLGREEPNKPGLYQNNRGDQANLPGIAFPQRWLTEQDLEEMKSSRLWFARKFHPDDAVLDRLDSTLDHQPAP